MSGNSSQDPTPDREYAVEGRRTDDTVMVAVRDPAGVAGSAGRERILAVDSGTVLRDALLEAGLSPYADLTERVNCGGSGLCATCGVRICDGPPADHWHDRLAAAFGYPRLSCQVVVDRAMTVELVDKRVWGSREPTT